MFDILSISFLIKKRFNVQFSEFNKEEKRQSRRRSGGEVGELNSFVIGGRKFIDEEGQIRTIKMEKSYRGERKNIQERGT